MSRGVKVGEPPGKCAADNAVQNLSGLPRETGRGRFLYAFQLLTDYVLILFFDQSDHHDDDADHGDYGSEDEGEHQAQIRYRGPEPSGFRVPLSHEIVSRNQHNDHRPDAADQGQETADQCFFHTQ